MATSTTDFASSLPSNIRTLSDGGAPPSPRFISLSVESSNVNPLKNSTIDDTQFRVTSANAIPLPPTANRALEETSTQPQLKETSPTSQGSAGSKEKESSNKASDKVKRVSALKRQSWAFLILSELILLILVIVQLVTIRNFLYDAGVYTTNQQLQLLQFQFHAKVDLAGAAFTTLANSAEVQSLVNPNISSVSRDLAISRIKAAGLSEGNHRKSEILMIVDDNKTIVVSMNTNRTGEVYDPMGLVSLAVSNFSTGQIRTTGVITYEELLKENPALVREGSQSFYAKQHMYDTHRDGLIRYMVTPITNAAVDVGLGAVIYADIMSGKTAFLQNSVGLFGNGFGKVVIVSDSGSIIPVVELMYRDNHKFSYSLEIVDSDLRHVVDQVLKSASYDTVITARWTVLGQDYFISAMRSQPLSVNKVLIPSLPTNAVLIRGYPVQEINSIYKQIILVDMALMAGCMLFDVLGMLVSVRLFVDPLEKLVLYVRMKAFDKYSESMKSINLAKRYLFRVSFFFLISLAFLFAMLFQNVEAVTTAFKSQSSSRTEVQMMSYAYQLKMLQMRNAILNGQRDSNVQNLMLNYSSTTSDAYNKSKNLLSTEITKRFIEIAIIADSAANIVLNARCDSCRGKYFNPRNIISDVLSSKRTLLITALMNTSEYLSTKPPVWTNSYANASLLTNSSLNPVNGFNGPLAVRLSAMPLWKTGNNQANDPDGVMVLGDLINGKAGLNELLVQAYKTGYAGTYYIDPVTKHIQLLSGVFRASEADRFENDVDLTNALQSHVDSVLELENLETLLFQITFRNELYELSIMPVSPSFFMDCDYNIQPVAEYSASLFHVRGTNASKWKSLESKQLAVQISSMIVQVLSSVGISYLLYKPVKKFIDSMSNKSRHHAKGGNSSQTIHSMKESVRHCWDSIISKLPCTGNSPRRNDSVQSAAFSSQEKRSRNVGNSFRSNPIREGKEE